MDTKLLEQFVEIARLGSYGHASKVLGLTQPSLTRHIGKLERDLGMKLLDRGPKGAVLTEAGRHFLPHAESILGALERAGSQVASAKGLFDAEVRIGISPNFLSHILPDAMDRLLTIAPNVKLEVSTGTHETLCRMLRAYELDLAFEQLPEVSASGIASNSNDLRFEWLLDLSYAVWAPAGHRLAGARSVTLADLAGERWAIPYQMSMSWRIENAFFRNGLERPIQIVNSSSLTFLRSAMLRWGLLAILPESVLADDIAHGRVKRVGVPELVLDYRAGLLFRRKTTLGAAAFELAKAIRQIASEMRDQAP
jgi:DNA-binding transcriptional LysR family regulator